MKKVIMAVICAALTNISVGQNAIDDILTQIESNNKTIKAAQHLLDAQQSRLKTGLNPEDPVLEADYLIGRPIEGGDQFEFTATQEFDFPTVYGKRKTTAEKSDALLQQDFASVRVNQLMKAKSLWINGIHLNKKRVALNKRKERLEVIAQDYEKKYVAEEISVLALNKARIQLLGMDVSLRDIETQIKINNAMLTEMNGGIGLSISELEFPTNVEVQPFEILVSEQLKLDPELLKLEQQEEVLEANLNLQKALKLPKFSAGYHYQSVLGQTFNGAHIGVRIPLWKQKHTVETAQIEIEWGKVVVEEYKNYRSFELQKTYADYLNLKQTFTDYQTILSDNDNEDLLKQLLLAEEINYITYALELEYLYSALDEMLETEMLYHLAIAKLLKYTL